MKAIYRRGLSSLAVKQPSTSHQLLSVPAHMLATVFYGIYYSGPFGKQGNFYQTAEITGKFLLCQTGHETKLKLRLNEQPRNTISSNDNIHHTHASTVVAPIYFRP